MFSPVLIMLFAGAVHADFQFDGGSGFLKGAISALAGGMLSIPAAMVGEGLKKIGVPGERVPPMTSAAGALIGYGLGFLGDALGGSGLREAGAQIGTQAGLMASYAHDRGWHEEGGHRKLAADISRTMPRRKHSVQVRGVPARGDHETPDGRGGFREDHPRYGGRADQPQGLRAYRGDGQGTREGSDRPRPEGSAGEGRSGHLDGRRVMGHPLRTLKPALTEAVKEIHAQCFDIVKLNQILTDEDLLKDKGTAVQLKARLGAVRSACDEALAIMQESDEADGTDD